MISLCLRLGRLGLARGGPTALVMGDGQILCHNLFNFLSTFLRCLCEIPIGFLHHLEKIDK